MVDLSITRFWNFFNPLGVNPDIFPLIVRVLGASWSFAPPGEPLRCQGLMFVVMESVHPGIPEVDVARCPLPLTHIGGGICVIVNQIFQGTFHFHLSESEC